MALFEAREVVAGYPQQRLTKPLSFTLEEGQVQAIVGASGSGKSTLLRTLSGLIDALSGQFRLLDREPAQWGWPNFRRQVVYVPQNSQFHDEDVGSALARSFRFKSTQSAYPLDLARTLLKRVGLASLGEQASVAKLSTGQRQRLALVRALLLKPRVLLLDEPTSALDEDSRDKVEQVLRDYLKDGLALVLVSHSSEQVQSFSTNEPLILAALKDDAL